MLFVNTTPLFSQTCFVDEKDVLCKAKIAHTDKWIIGFPIKILHNKKLKWCIADSFVTDVYGCLTGHYVFIEENTICRSIGIYDSTKWEDLSFNEQTEFLNKWNEKEYRKNTKDDWDGKLIYEGDEVILGIKDNKVTHFKLGDIEYVPAEFSHTGFLMISSIVVK